MVWYVKLYLKYVNICKIFKIWEMLKIWNKNSIKWCGGKYGYNAKAMQCYISEQAGVFTCLEVLQAQWGEKVKGSHPGCIATFLLSNYTYWGSLDLNSLHCIVMSHNKRHYLLLKHNSFL